MAFIPIETKIIKDSADPSEMEIYVFGTSESGDTLPTGAPLATGMCLETDTGKIYGYGKTAGWTEIGSLGGGE